MFWQSLEYNNNFSILQQTLQSVYAQETTSNIPMQQPHTFSMIV